MATKPDAVKQTNKRERLTDKRIEKLVAPKGGRIELSDTLVRELSMRVGKSGKKSWSVIYRVAGQGAGGIKGGQKRMTLGTYPLLSLSDARDRARTLLDEAERGIDPRAAKADEIDMQRTRTFEAVLERYVELHVKPNTKDGREAADRAAAAARDTERGGQVKATALAPAERLLREHVEPKWEGRPLETISRAEVNTLLDDVVTGTGASVAREVRKHLAGMFNWAADRGIIAVSPVAGLRRKDLRYRSRERVLSMEELARVWEAAGEAAYPFGDLVRLIILTGQRRSEIANLQRSWLDEEGRAFEVPASSYKTNRDHVVPLSPPAWALVQGLPRWNEGDFMFSTTGGARPVSGFSKAKARLDGKIEKRGRKVDLDPIEPWTLHDLRRSVATHMARLGVQQEYIERVLGHVVSGVAGTYNRYSYLDEKRAALELWGKNWPL